MNRSPMKIIIDNIFSMNEIYMMQIDSIPCNMLNIPVITFVPLQGITEVTILEAAIIMRLPMLVAKLLQMGANPNITTSGISLLYQLIQALPMDPSPNTRIIISMLEQSGSYVPPGYPGTQGYLPRAIRQRY